MASKQIRLVFVWGFYVVLLIAAVTGFFDELPNRLSGFFIALLLFASMSGRASVWELEAKIASLEERLGRGDNSEFGK